MPEIDLAAALHAARHAADGPDRITPRSIGALPADSPKVGDTGWRLLALDNGWAGSFKARRIGSVVYISATGLDSSAATSANLLTLPTGFEPGAGFPVRGLANMTSGFSASVSGYIGATGGGANQIVRASSASGWANGSASTQFAVTSAFPTTLPGTPA